MKNMKYINGLWFALLCLVASCTDFVEPNVPYKDFDTGVYLRTIERQSVTFTYNNIDDFFDVANSNFALILEAVDAENGATVETVEIRARHRRIIPGVGLEYRPEQDVLIRTLTRDDFAPNDQSRFLRASFDIPAAEVLEATGISAEEVQGGDTFEFRLVLTDRQGRVFSNHNRSSDVAGGFFYDSPFQYNVDVVCPSEISTGEEVWNASTTSNFGNFSSQVIVRPVAGNDIQYVISDVSAGLFAAFGFSEIQEGIYQDACGAISWVSEGNTEFSLTDPEEVGSWDGETLIIYWYESLNGIRGETVLTRAQ